MSCTSGLQTYRVYQLGLSSWKLVCADSAERAMKKVRSKTYPATKAELVRPSSYWQEQRRLGAYPVRGKRIRRRGAGT